MIRKPFQHGTRYGYMRHRDDDEIPCEACTAANARYIAERRSGAVRVDSEGSEGESSDIRITRTPRGRKQGLEPYPVDDNGDIIWPARIAATAARLLAEASPPYPTPPMYTR